MCDVDRKQCGKSDYVSSLIVTRIICSPPLAFGFTCCGGSRLATPLSANIVASMQLQLTHPLSTRICKMMIYEEKLLLCLKTPVLTVLEGHKHADIEVTPTADGVGLEISKVGHDASRRGGGEMSAWGGVMCAWWACAPQLGACMWWRCSHGHLGARHTPVITTFNIIYACF